jgi:hypothetical protein
LYVGWIVFLDPEFHDDLLEHGLPLGWAAVLVDLLHPGPDLGKEVLGDKRNRVLGDLGVELLSRSLQAAFDGLLRACDF